MYGVCNNSDGDEFVLVAAIGVRSDGLEKQNEATRATHGEQEDGMVEGRCTIAHPINTGSFQVVRTRAMGAHSLV